MFDVCLFVAVAVAVMTAIVAGTGAVGIYVALQLLY